MQPEDVIGFSIDLGALVKHIATVTHTDVWVVQGGFAALGLFVVWLALALWGRARLAAHKRRLAQFAPLYAEEASRKEQEAHDRALAIYYALNPWARVVATSNPYF